MEKKKVPQNVLDTNVSNETIRIYALKHEIYAHLFGLCVILPYLCLRKFKIIKRNEEIFIDWRSSVNGFKFNFCRWYSHQH